MTITPENRNQELGKFFNALKDRTLEPDDAAYVPHVHDEQSGDPIADLARQILWSEGGGTYLFTGQRGTGKSTELRRLRRDLQAQNCEVFLLDMAEYLHETEPVEIGDFLISLMGALSDAVAQKFDQAILPAQESYWERIEKFLQTGVSIKEVDLKGIKLSLKDDRTFKQAIQAMARGKVGKLVADAGVFATDLMQKVKLVVGDKRIVVIADSVERLRGVNAESSKQVFDSAIALFSGNPDHLKFSGIHMVYSVPPYLSALTANLSALYNSQLVSLASAHVYASPSAGPARQPNDLGLAAMEKMVAQRYPAWQEVLSKVQLRRLALASGGDFRDFFRLLGAVLVKAGNPANALPVGDVAVDAAENAMRREMLPIPDNHKDWLKRIAKSHDSELADIADLATFAGFLDGRVVLNYRNGKDWYDVHPLLWEVIDSHEPRVAAAG